MTQYTKPTVLPAWGESAGGADVLQPTNAEIQAGWPLSNVPPSRKRFNWILKYLAQGVRYMMQMGIPVWDSTEDYPINARVMGSDGKTYKALQTSTNQNPVSAPTYWQLWGTEGRDDQLQLTTAFTTAGASGTFTLAATPAPTALAANLRFRVKFHTAGNGTDTINVNGLGAKSLKQYDRAGSKVSAVVTANQLADIEYDGVDFVILDPLPISGAQTFTTNGTFTVPTGVSRVFVTLVGGGGGGAGSLSGAPYFGGGGGGGGVVFKSTQTVTPGQTIAVTIGAGGAGGLGSNFGGTYATSNGASGGTTSFGALVSVSGGGGGRCQSGDSGGGAAGSSSMSASGFSGNVPTSGENGGGGGGTIFGPSYIGGHSSLTGISFGCGGCGGRGTASYWANGGTGAPGFCLVEW